MATYAIGDVQGCLSALERLLVSVRFDPSYDHLWFVGDLVNRGPDSLGVLRLVRALGDRAITVLGNHDLHLLAIAAGGTRQKPRDTLQPILTAPDRDELLDWLCQRPILHLDRQRKMAMVHAGLLPEWDLDEALMLAQEVEERLRGPEGHLLLQHMYGNDPNRWSSDLRGYERLRVVLNGFTRLRYCHRDGRLDLHQKGSPGTQGPDLLPWYAVPGRRSGDTTVIFGHWSTLGTGRFDNVLALDGGCVWGGTLTAVRLEDQAFFRVACPECVEPSIRSPQHRMRF